MIARIATIAGRSIPISRLEERFVELRRGPRARHMPPDAAGGAWLLRRWLVQELVREEVLLHEAQVRGISVGDGSAGLSPNELALLVAHVTADVAIAEADARAYYERNPDLYRRSEACRVRHVLLPDEATARLVAERAATGGDLAELARPVSIDGGSRTRGGFLGDVHRGELAGALEDAIFGASVGTVVGPIHTEHGWHVVRVEAATAESQVPFAKVRPKVEAELLAAARVRAFDDWLEGRRRALAVIEPDYEHPGHPVHGIASHRH